MASRLLVRNAAKQLRSNSIIKPVGHSSLEWIECGADRMLYITRIHSSTVTAPCYFRLNPSGHRPPSLRNPDTLRIAHADHNAPQRLHCSYRCCSICSDCDCWCVALSHRLTVHPAPKSWLIRPISLQQASGLMLEAEQRATLLKVSPTS